MNNTLIFRQLFDEKTLTYTYILADSDTREAIIIDPVRDQVERDSRLMAELGLKLIYILDTHIHADHITGSGLLREKTGAKIVLGA
jgi:glyoxylase-like metal-dependent hydrolase (beta-lactamase superfamily II)